MFDIMTFATFILSLLLVIGMMYGAVYLLKKFGIGTGPATLSGFDKQKRKLELLEILPIDTKRRLVRVKAGDKEHLILTSPSNDLLIDSEETTLDEQKKLTNAN